MPRLPLELHRLDLDTFAHQVQNSRLLREQPELARYGEKNVPGRQALLDELNALAGGRRDDGPDDIRGDYLGFHQDLPLGKIIWFLNCRQV